MTTDIAQFVHRVLNSKPNFKLEAKATIARSLPSAFASSPVLKAGISTLIFSIFNHSLSMYKTMPRVHRYPPQKCHQVVTNRPPFYCS